MQAEKRSCESCPPGTVDELQNIRSHVGICALHWHKYSVDIAAIVVGSSIALAGYVLTRDNLATPYGYALSVVIAVIGIVGCLAIGQIKKQFYVHTNILRKIDMLTGVFCTVRYAGLHNEMLYPAEWKHSGTSEYTEPLIKFVRLTALITPIVLAVIVAFTVFKSS